MSDAVEPAETVRYFTLCQTALFRGDKLELQAVRIAAGAPEALAGPGRLDWGPARRRQGIQRRSRDIIHRWCTAGR